MTTGTPNTSSSVRSETSQSTETVEEHWLIRRWRRVDPPRWDFWPWGLLPLLGLGGVFLYGFTGFAHDDIESTVRDRVRRSLDSQGMNWVRITSVDGQDVTLGGQLPQTGDDERALSVARAAMGPTWAGEKICACTVGGAFEAPAPPPPPPPPAVEWPDWRYSMRDGVLRLTGSVPDEPTHEYVVGRARALVSPPKIREVIDELRVTGRPAPEAFRPACERGLSVLQQCEAGSTTLISGVFAVHCDVTRATHDPIDTAAKAPVNGMRIGDVELLVHEDVMACEAALDAILRSSTITFQISSAIIAQTNNPLLDRVAAAARTCPGTLRIEGHTDGMGSRPANMTLSDARAASVRTALTERGLDATRLRSQGFGPDRPVAPNTTIEGRSRNRRIEIHVVHDGE
jgi:outer membrane protein OmpA-like peptidoglycan-associated protein